MKRFGQNLSIGSRDRVQPCSFGQFCFLYFGLYCLGSSDVESLVKITGTSGSLEPYHHCPASNEVAKLHRLFAA